jgi:hypothetical protein
MDLLRFFSITAIGMLVLIGFATAVHASSCISCGDSEDMTTAADDGAGAMTEYWIINGALQDGAIVDSSIAQSFLYVKMDVGYITESSNTVDDTTVIRIHILRTSDHYEYDVFTCGNSTNGVETYTNELVNVGDTLKITGGFNAEAYILVSIGDAFVISGGFNAETKEVTLGLEIVDPGVNGSANNYDATIYAAYVAPLFSGIESSLNTSSTGSDATSYSGIVVHYNPRSSATDFNPIPDPALGETVFQNLDMNIQYASNGWWIFEIGPYHATSNDYTVPHFEGNLGGTYDAGDE